MTRILLTVIAVGALAAVVAAAPSIEGQWHVEFATPLGQRTVNMTIEQTGASLHGHVDDQYGEYDLSGRFDKGRVTATWAWPEHGRMVDITMRGTLDGNTIDGTATIADVGEGALSARRIGSVR